MPNVLIKLLTSRAGNGFNQSPGQEVEIEADEASRMVQAGLAEFVTPAPAEPSETAPAASSDVPAGATKAKAPKKTKTPPADNATAPAGSIKKD